MTNVQWNPSVMVTLGPISVAVIERGGYFKEVCNVWSFATWSLN